MKRFFKSIPVPMTGLILAVLSVGTLLNTYGITPFGDIIAAIGAILMILILAKLIFVFEHTKPDLKNPVIASTIPTFSMGMMVLCTYLLKWFNADGLVSGLWLLSIALQIGMVLYFTYYFLISQDDFTIEHIYPSWFVVYCGLGIVPITCGNFYPVIGRAIFWSALLFYFILLPVIIYRVYIHRRFEEHTVPLITITAAPGSLCLTGYLAAFPHPHIVLVTLLVVLSQILYLLILLKLPQMLNRDFYPSYAAFTFPLVICATALTKSYQYYLARGMNFEWMNWLAVLETIIAIVVVAYVFVEYMKHLIRVNKKEEPTPQTDANQAMDV